MANNKILNPKAKNALDKMKHETANEVGVGLKPGYNGDISTHDAGKIGGNMVKKMVKNAEDNMAGNKGK